MVSSVDMGMGRGTIRDRGACLTLFANHLNGQPKMKMKMKMGQSRVSPGSVPAIVNRSVFFNVFTLPICNRCAIHTNQRHGRLLPQTPRDARLLPVGLRFLVW